MLSLILMGPLEHYHGNTRNLGIIEADIPREKFDLSTFLPTDVFILVRVGDIRGDVYSKETEREEQIWICILLKTKKSEYKHIIICIHFVICLLTPQLFHTHTYRLCLLLTKP